MDDLNKRSDEIRAHNREAWNREVEKGNPWTKPVSSETIDAARNGDWEVYLTDYKPAPRDWFPELKGLNTLCLASGGGQQGPILAATGAKVTVFDNSPRQLERDRSVADANGLELSTVEGDMADLSVFDDESFDLVFHPVSNLFVPDVHPVWREAYRVLRHGGVLMSGFINPVEYTFDIELAEKGVFTMKYPPPYSDLTSITDEERLRFFSKDSPIEFGHSLTDQIGGQLKAGFMLTGLYESHRVDEPIAKYIPTYIATRAIKP